MTSPTEPISGNTYPPLILAAKPGQQVFSNPPFDSRILNIAGGNSAIAPPSSTGSTFGNRGQNGVLASLQRGRLVSGGSVPGSTTGPTFMVNFLYNPSTIYESRGLDLTGTALPAWQRNQGDPGQFATGLATTISFDLLFDRTFELWDQSYRATIPGKYGCRADVEALYNLVGINQPSSTTPTAQSTTVQGPVAPANFNVTVQGPMLQNPTNLYFSPNNKGGLSYYGFIQSMNITWTHFSSAMTPQRCAVSLTFVNLPQTASNYTGPNNF